MDILHLSALGLVGNLVIFLIASGIVWIGGVRLARGADALADQAGCGHAYLGVFLLGAMVSLPEMTFASVAAVRGHAALAVNGLLGGIGITMVVIAIVDYVVGQEPLSADIQRPVVMFQGAMVALMLTVAAAGIVAGDRLVPAIGVAGLWTLALVVLYVMTIIAVKRLEPRVPWKAEPIPVRESRGE
jgi:cation:H+ antiporter